MAGKKLRVVRRRLRVVPKLTHLDAEGRARMVDVGDKAVTRREAVARARVRMNAATLEAIMQGTLDKVGEEKVAVRLAAAGTAD